MPDFKWVADKFEHLVSIGPNGVIVLLAFVIVIMAVMAVYAWYKGIIRSGKELENVWTMLAASHEETRVAQEACQREREDARARHDEALERWEDQRREMQERHELRLRVYETALLMSNRQLDREQEQKERLATVMEKAVAGDKAV